MLAKALENLVTFLSKTCKRFFRGVARQIGIRMALGATTTTKQTGVIAKRLRLAFLGMAVGSVAWFAAARGIASLLFGTAPRDPATFAGMILLLNAVAFVSRYIPTPGASPINPITALRSN